MFFEQRKILKIFPLTILAIFAVLLTACGEIPSATTGISDSGKVTAQTTENADAPKPSEISDKPVLPEAYTTSCAKCHGANGEGKDKNPELLAVTTRKDDPLSDKDLRDIIDDPSGFGLSSKMPSFKDKLSEQQKQEIVRWIKTL